MSVRSLLELVDGVFRSGSDRFGTCSASGSDGLCLPLGRSAVEFLGIVQWSELQRCALADRPFQPLAHLSACTALVAIGTLPDQ